MGKLVEQQEVRKALLEKKKTRKETMGKYFYDLSKLTFAALALGGTVSFFQGIEMKWLMVMALGVIFALVLAYIGNYILK